MSQATREPNGREKKPVVEFFQHWWSQALVTVSSAEDEASKLLGKVEGLAGWGPEEARKQLEGFTERLTSQRREVERRVDESLKEAIARLRVPRRDEVAQLQARLDALGRRLEALSK